MTARPLKILIACLGLACALAAPATPAHAAPVIQVKPVVEVDGAKNEITLGDIMEMHGFDAITSKSMKAVRLADAPKPGEVRSFTDVGIQQIIRTHLRGQAGLEGEEVVLRIPTRVTVSRQSLQLRASDISGELLKQFRGVCADCDFEISGLSIPAIGERIPAGSSWSIKIRPELPRGGFSLPLEVSNEDGTRRIFWVSGTLAVRKQVPVAARSLMIGERLSAEDFNMMMKDVTFATDSAAASIDMTTSLVARQLAAGEVIWKSALRREMAVRMGDPVKVFIGNEAWQITTEGVAQGAGYIGDQIRVKIPRTQKIISGLLREKGRVEVQ